MHSKAEVDTCVVEVLSCHVPFLEVLCWNEGALQHILQAINGLLWSPASSVACLPEAWQSFDLESKDGTACCSS